MTFPRVFELVSSHSCQYALPTDAGRCLDDVEFGFQRDEDDRIGRYCLHHANLVAGRWGITVDENKQE